ncbi:MAG: hypothetical protein ACFE96_00590 [Candidatus Hermodarchaeota archaeon]
MPEGMFLLIHDEIIGPEIKCSFFENQVNLNNEFISKLYMAHAGFDSSSHIEIKFENYRSVSCFTGNLNRKTQKEGILGIIFGENEEYDNLDLFLQRNLYHSIDNPSDQILESIFSDKLLNYLKLNDLFQKIEIEGVTELYLVSVNSEYKYTILKIGESSISTPEMTILYKKFLSNQIILPYYWEELNLGEGNKTFLVLKSEEPQETIKMLITTIKSYLEKFYYYSLEILALLLLPSVIKLLPARSEFSKTSSTKDNSLLQSLQKSNNYQEDFNTIISILVNGNVYISPEL